MAQYLSEHFKILDAKLDAWAKGSSDVWGIPTGIPSLDRMLGGFQQDDVVVIAGRPSMGKTAMAGQIGFDTARYFKSLNLPEPPTVVFFEAETRAWQLLLRELSRQSGVPAYRMKTGFLTDSDARAIAQARAEILSLPMVIIDTHAISTVQVKNELKRMRETWKLNIGQVFYDHVNLAGDEAFNDYKRVSQAADNLRMIAKGLGVPVVILAQVGRQNERSEDHMPMLSDLKDSGKIEEAADVVIFIHRPEYYKRLVDRSKAPDEPAVLLVAKNREGDTGIVPVTFYPQFTEFRERTDVRVKTPQDRPEGVPV